MPLAISMAMTKRELAIVEEGCQGLVLRQAWLVAKDSSVEGGLAELFAVDEKVAVIPLVLRL